MKARKWYPLAERFNRWTRIRSLMEKRKEEICEMCGMKINKRDDVITITKGSERIAMLCVECYNGGTGERPVKLSYVNFAILDF